MRGTIRGGAGVVRGGRPGFVAVTGAGGIGGLFVLPGLGGRGFGGVPVLTGESDLGDTVDFSFDGPVVCGKRVSDDTEAG